MNFPRDPLRQNNRLIEAVCSDMLNGTTGSPERVREIARQINSKGRAEANNLRPVDDGN